MSPRRAVAPQPPPLAEREKPGLSETLPHAQTAGLCAACGKRLLWTDPLGWGRWTEDDAWDRPQPVVVALCQRCAGRLIEPHPRQYRAMHLFDPMPGAMPICEGCPARAGWRCTRAKTHGGDGVYLRQDKGTVAHLNYGGGRGEWLRLRDRWPIRCRSADGSFVREHSGLPDSRDVALAYAAARDAERKESRA